MQSGTILTESLLTTPKAIIIIIILLLIIIIMFVLDVICDVVVD